MNMAIYRCKTSYRYLIHVFVKNISFVEKFFKPFPDIELQILNYALLSITLKIVVINSQILILGLV